jgi:hypothetical protein
MLFSVGEDHDFGDDAVVGESVVHFDGTLAGFVLGPVEHFQTELDDGGVEGVERVFEGEGMAGSEVLEPLQEILVGSLKNFKGAVSVGVSDGGAVDGLGAEVVEGTDVSVKGGLEVAERILAGGLGKEHEDEVLPRLEGLDVAVRLEFVDDGFKRAARD